MSGTGRQFSYLSDPRLAVHALSSTPVWLWSADATCVLWANPVAAAIFDAASPGALAALTFASDHAAAAQVARLAGTLPQGSAPRLERLRGFGASLGGTLICLCSRIALADNSAAVLVVATERAGKDLSLPDRAQRLLADLGRPAAVFSADGELIEATPEARERFGDKRDLDALGAERLAREASLNGHAEGDIAAWPATLIRLGAGATVTLLVAFAAPEKPASLTPAAQATPSEAVTVGPRRHPLRFVWQMDAANRFTLGGEDFAKLLGPKTAAVLDRPWGEIAAKLKLDPQGSVEKALAARDTWSGIVVAWPVDDDDQPLPIEMSGLPVFDRDRQFEGFRGFGICRDVERLTALEQRRAQPAPASAPPPAAVEAKPQAPVDNVPSTMCCRSPRRRPKSRRPNRRRRSAQASAAPSRNWRANSAAGSSIRPASPSTDARRTISGPNRRRRRRRAAARGAQRRCRPRHQRRPADPRPPAGRHPGLSPQHADLRQPRLPRLDRLRQSG